MSDTRHPAGLRTRSTWPASALRLFGTGTTGVQIIPKIASDAKELTVFQRTPNYVLPGRNYTIDEDQSKEIKDNYDATWNAASNHGYGLAMKSSGRTIKDMASLDDIRQILDTS